MMSMGSALVLGGKRNPLLRFLQKSDQMYGVVDERGMQAWGSPTVHCLYSAVCKTEPPGGRDVCVSQARRGIQALPGRLHHHHLVEPIHSQWQQGMVGERSEVEVGRGAAAV